MIKVLTTLTNDIVSFEKLGPGWYFAFVQDDLNLCILHMFEDTFLLDTAQAFVHHNFLPYLF